MLKEQKERLTKIFESLNKLRGWFELEKKEPRIAELEKFSQERNFWGDSDKARKVMQELANLKKSVETFEGLKKNASDLNTLVELTEEEESRTRKELGEKDSFLREITSDIGEIESKINTLTFQYKLRGEYDKNNAIVTLHSGAGGTEACDWVEMLLRMYIRWAERKNYKITIVDIFPGDEAGIKRITFVVAGEYAYGYLTSEIGVHRLVRISPFDANKRRHTSFASCDVIPEVDQTIKIDINDKDLRIDTYRASGHGGQHINKTDSAVRITHLPTGIVTQCQSDRSQHKNKAEAIKLLRARLFEFERDKRRKETERHYNEKGEIAWGNQIRSYVFCPYTMVKDHRTSVEMKDVDGVMDGDIDEFVEGYLEK
ncbi:peptide chain release factor 2 [bacterium]|nr:peptide chain release factor 2 [bacterium]